MVTAAIRGTSAATNQGEEPLIACSVLSSVHASDPDGNHVSEEEMSNGGPTVILPP
jgi:hypothetical protein